MSRPRHNLILLRVSFATSSGRKSAPLGQRENLLFYPFLTPLRPAPTLNIHGKIRGPKAGFAVRISNFGFRVFSPGVFAPLVGALVFKTSGRLEESRQWVRFPYTPVYLRKIRNAIPNPTSHG